MRPGRLIYGAVAAALAGLAAVAFLRVGLLDLPTVPDELTATDAGLQDLDALREWQRTLDSTDLPTGARGEADWAVEMAARGLAAVRAGDPGGGLDLLEAAVERAPGNLVLGNALRMEVFRLRRGWQLSADGAGGLLPAPPPYLEQRPLAFLRRLADASPEPEVRLQLAAALLDEMLLTPALEVQAGVTVEAMEILAGLLREESAGPYYLPALYARGLVYLHRPAHLLWSERIEDVLTAARQDMALTVAVGRRFELGSPALQGRLALALGDTYAKEGRPDRARSWWQIADAVTGGELRPRVMQRMSWRDDEMLDRLAEVLERELRDLERPLSDMSLLWQPTADP